MAEPVIKNFEEIISEKLSRNEFIEKTEILNLLAPGENYLSQMMKIRVNTKNRITEAEREINAVAKCVAKFPSNMEFLKDMSPFFFMKEISFYKEILPTIQSFLKRRGMSPADYFVEYYGDRLTLSGEDKPADHAVLLLENLQVNGYQNQDRHEGFDFEGAKLIIKDLAHLHSICIAIKLLEPELFKEKILKNCQLQFPPPPPPADGKKPAPPPGIPDEVLVDILQEDKTCVPLIPKVKEVIEEQKKLGFEAILNEKIREPFATLTHSDMWTNNTMQKLDSKGRPIRNKIVDFQVYNYSNPARDLLFFLNTSVQSSALRTRFEYLMKYYHDHFVKVLADAGCDIAPFSYDKFLEEVKAVAPSVILHSSFMMMVIVFGKKGIAADPVRAQDLTKEDIHPTAQEKFRVFIVEMCKRGWIE